MVSPNLVWLLVCRQQLRQENCQFMLSSACSRLRCFPYKTAVQADQLGCRNRDRRWVILSVISAVTTGWRISESAEPGNFKIKMSWTETRGIKFVLLYSSSMYDLKVPEIEILQETIVEHVDKYSNNRKSNISDKNSTMILQELMKCYIARRKI